MTELTELSGSKLSRLLSAGEVSSAQITQAFIERIEQHNQQLNCFLSVETDSALAQAQRADELRSTTKTAHPICGVPIAIKDIFERPGHNVTAGSKPFAFQSSTTATVVNKLNHKGGVILGTLQLDEFAAGGTGGNTHFGRCLNPLNPAYLTGGSSSGSAAAVGAKLAPITLGSDAGGSIRLPAGYCGATGLKPTYGRVSRYGAVPRTWSMDCIGPLAQSAEDCALMMDAISGIDPEDPTTFDSTTTFWPLNKLDVREITIGVDYELLDSVSEDQTTGIQLAVSRYKDLGARIIEMKMPDIDLLNDLHQVIVKSEGACFIGSRVRADAESVSLATRSVIQEGMVISATRYIDALSIRSKMLEDFVNNGMNNADFLLLPLSTDNVPPFIESDNAEARLIEKQFSASARFTRFSNYLGIPTIAFPVSKDRNNMPVSVQLLGRPWSEKKLLQAAQVLQNDLPWNS